MEADGIHEETLPEATMGTPHRTVPDEAADSTVGIPSLTPALTEVLARWSEPLHHDAAAVIQRWTRGKQGRTLVTTMRRVVNEVRKKNKVVKNRKKNKHWAVAPMDDLVSGTAAAPASEPGHVMQLRSFRVLKMATIGFKGYKIDTGVDACEPDVAAEACKPNGQWRYELTLEQVVPSDVGNVLVGWASSITSDADAWLAGLANGETPQFAHPTRWWGPVFNRAQLAADAPDEATVVIGIAVDLDASMPMCWYNLYVDRSPPQDEGMRLESIYASSSNPSGWNALEMPILSNDGGATGPPPVVYPAVALSSSVGTTLNFGQTPFECPAPEHGSFSGLVPLGSHSPVRLHKLLLLGGFVLSIDYRERMPGLIELLAQKGWWDLLRLMLAGKWDLQAREQARDLVASALKEEDKAMLDGDSMDLLSDDNAADIEPQRILCMTNGQSKTLIHIAIENKRFTFVDRLFDWLPPNADKELEKLSANADSSMDEEKVLKAETKLLATQDLNGCNPLLLAIENGQDKLASRILDKAIAIDETYRRRILEEGVEAKGEATARESVTSRIATQKNESGQAALWAAIETKSDLALRLVDIQDVNNNERHDFGTTPLMRAVEIDNVPMIDELLDAGEGSGGDSGGGNMVDLTLVNEYGFSAVTLASYLPDRELVLEKLLDKAERRGVELETILAAQCKTEAKRTALMYAIDSENTASAKVLLSYYSAVYQRNPEKAMELASIKGGSGATALIIAIDEKNADVVDALVDLLSKESLKQKYRDKEPIALAIKNANVPPESTDGSPAAYLPESSVEKLVAARFQNVLADQNDAGDAELLSSLLDDAVNFSLFRVVTALLHQGAKPRKPSTAAAAGDIEFFESNDDLNEKTINEIHLEKDNSGSTYLMLACRAGSIEFVTYLLDRYSEKIVADVQNRDTGETAVITAARGGHVQIVKKLLQWAKRKSKTSRFMASKPVELGSMEPLEIVEKSEEEVSPGDRIGLDVHAKDKTNLLMALCSMSSNDQASTKELQEVIDVLSRMTTEHIKKREERLYAEEQRPKGNMGKAKGISPIKVKALKKDFANLQDVNGDTALDLAVRNGNIELAMSLKLAWGAAVGFRSAAVIGSIAEFRLLVDAATAVSESDPRDLFTPLHLACRNTLAGSADKALMLLERSADPSLQTREGWTPLMFACSNVEADGKVATVQALLEHHADTDLQNADGSTALTLTLKGKTPFSPKQMLVAAMLVGAGADLFLSDNSGYCALSDCSEIAGDALESKGDEDYADIFATMINRGVHIGSLEQSVDKAVRAQRGFVLPDFDLEELRTSGMGAMTNPSEDLIAKTSIVLRAYSAMEPEEIARCATYIFVHDGLFVAMMKGMWLAHLADAEARRVRALDAGHAASLSALSDRVQLSVAGLLSVKQDASPLKQDASPSGERSKAFVQDFLEKYKEGETVLMAASKYQMKAVLSHPEIQRYSERLWFGWMHHDLKSAPKLVRFLAVAASLWVQLLLSPIVGLLPFIGRKAQEDNNPALNWLSRFFGVPVIDFVSASVCNMAFNALLLYYAANGTLYDQPPWWTWSLFAWASADLWVELVELTDGFSPQSMQKEFFALFSDNYRSEYIIDPFNIFDLTSCVCATAGLLWFNIARQVGAVTIDTPIAELHLQHGSLGHVGHGIATAAHDDDPSEAFFVSVHISGVRYLLTGAVYFGWMRMLRLLSMSETMGPLILMFLQMFNDIFQWIVLTIIILFSTTSALYVLHALGAPKTFLFIGCSPEGTPFTRFGNAFKKVIEGSLVGDPYFECMAHHNESVDYWVAWVVAVGFQIVVGLLLVNMLIAKMAKTFDSIWENQGVNFMYLRARTCMAWDEAPLVCSPFVILSWPTIFVRKLIDIAKWAKAKLVDDDAEREEPSAQESATKGTGTKQIGSSKSGSPKGSPKLDPVPGYGNPPPMEGIRSKMAPPRPGSPKRRADGSNSAQKPTLKGGGGGTVRKLLTSVGKRDSLQEKNGSDGTQQSWTKQQEAEICDLLMNWILDHEDEVNQSERWRTDMQKKNAKRFDRVDRGINSLAASLKEVKKNQLAGVMMQDKLLELKNMVEELQKRNPSTKS